MTTSRAWVGLLLLISFGAAPSSFASLDRSIGLHYDRATAKTLVVVEGSDGQAIASVSWSGPLVLGEGSYEEAILLPTLLLAELRDRADASRHQEHQIVAREIRDWMGPYATTSTNSIPDTSMTRVVVAHETSTWCGERVDDQGKCPSSCSSGNGVQACSACGCRGSKTWLRR